MINGVLTGTQELHSSAVEKNIRPQKGRSNSGAGEGASWFEKAKRKSHFAKLKNLYVHLFRQRLLPLVADPEQLCAAMTSGDIRSFAQHYTVYHEPPLTLDAIKGLLNWEQLTAKCVELVQTGEFTYTKNLITLFATMQDEVWDELSIELANTVLSLFEQVDNPEYFSTILALIAPLLKRVPEFVQAHCQTLFAWMCTEESLEHVERMRFLSTHLARYFKPAFDLCLTHYSTVAPHMGSTSLTYTSPVANFLLSDTEKAKRDTQLQNNTCARETFILNGMRTYHLDTKQLIARANCGEFVADYLATRLKKNQEATHHIAGGKAIVMTDLLKIADGFEKAEILPLLEDLLKRLKADPQVIANRSHILFDMPEFKEALKTLGLQERCDAHVRECLHEYLNQHVYRVGTDVDMKMAMMELYIRVQGEIPEHIYNAVFVQFCRCTEVNTKLFKCLTKYLLESTGMFIYIADSGKTYQARKKGGSTQTNPGAVVSVAQERIPALLAVFQAHCKYLIAEKRKAQAQTALQCFTNLQFVSPYDVVMLECSVNLHLGHSKKAFMKLYKVLQLYTSQPLDNHDISKDEIDAIRLMMCIDFLLAPNVTFRYQGEQHKGIGWPAVHELKENDELDVETMHIQLYEMLVGNQQPEAIHLMNRTRRVLNGNFGFLISDEPVSLAMPLATMVRFFNYHWRKPHYWYGTRFVIGLDSKEKVILQEATLDPQLPLPPLSNKILGCLVEQIEKLIFEKDNDITLEQLLFFAETLAKEFTNGERVLMSVYCRWADDFCNRLLRPNYPRQRKIYWPSDWSHPTSYEDWLEQFESLCNYMVGANKERLNHPTVKKLLYKVTYCFCMQLIRQPKQQNKITYAIALANYFRQVDEIQSLLLKAQIYYQLGKFRKAIATYQDVLNTGDTSARDRANYRIASIMQKHGIAAKNTRLASHVVEIPRQTKLALQQFPLLFNNPIPAAQGQMAVVLNQLQGEDSVSTNEVVEPIVGKEVWERLKQSQQQQGLFATQLGRNVAVWQHATLGAIVESKQTIEQLHIRIKTLESENKQLQAGKNSGI